MENKKTMFPNVLEHLEKILKKTTTTDISAITPSNLSFYSKQNLGRKRNTMPQLDKNDVLIHFSNEVGKGKGVKKVKKALSKLKPAQDEVNFDKLIDMQKGGHDWRNREYVISRDNYIIDGHHAYALGLEEEPEYEVTCYKINLPATDLIKRCNQLKSTKKEDIEGNITKAIIQLFNL